MLLKGLSEAAVKAVFLSQEETRRLNHKNVGSETLLLGLMGAGGLAAQAISSAHITLGQARFEVEKHVGRGIESSSHEPAFTPRVKRIFELAWSIAKEQEGIENYLSTKHLLLGLLDESDNRLPGGGVIILRLCSVDLPSLKEKTLSLTKEMSVTDMPHDDDDSSPPARGEGGSPLNRGPWPPTDDPDDPSRVPLRRKPSDKGSEIALPIPDFDDLDL